MYLDEKMIVHIGAEVVPFSKMGGLGDVIGSLPTYLEKKSKYNNIVITPYYDSIQQPLKLFGKYNIKFNEVNYEYKILYTEKDNITYYFVKSEEAYALQNGYTDGSKPYLIDVGLEYFFFGKCAVEFLKNTGNKNITIIAHDWHSCGIYPYIKEIEDKIKKNIYVIHNYQHQGQLYPDIFKHLEHKVRTMAEKILQSTDTISMSAFGIFNADEIITVSKNYARELSEKLVAHPSLEYFEFVGKKPIGILNGIDTTKWNPNKKDRLLGPAYDINSYKNKKINKSKLKSKYGINSSDLRPLVLIMCRLTEQKGLDIFLNMGNRRPFDPVNRMKELIDLGIDIIVCGVPSGGSKGKVNKQLLMLQNKLKGNFCYIDSYSDLIAEQLLAGCDILLHPSNYEPCGLTPMYAMRYGTIPIVTNTGGLPDIVEDIDIDVNNGTGFLIENASFKEVYKGTIRAINVFNDEESWNRIIERCMDKEFSWNNSISEYIKIIEG